jgi:hypothetical protein
LGTAVTNQNLNQKKIKRRLNSGNACYHSFQNETWSLTLREEPTLRMFENMVLRRIFGLRRDEVTGEWRKLHNEELHNLYSSPNTIKMIK